MPHTAWHNLIVVGPRVCCVQARVREEERLARKRANKEAALAALAARKAAAIAAPDASDAAAGSTDG